MQTQKSNALDSSHSIQQLKIQTHTLINGSRTATLLNISVNVCVCVCAVGKKAWLDGWQDEDSRGISEPVGGPLC